MSVGFLVAWSHLDSHGLDRIQKLRYAGDVDNAKTYAPYFAAIRLATNVFSGRAGGGACVGTIIRFLVLDLYTGSSVVGGDPG